MKNASRRMASLLCLMAAATACTTDSPVVREPSSAASSRVQVYETMIRYLVNPRGTQPIHVLTNLCFDQLSSQRRCPGRLSRREEVLLRSRLADLGDVEFRSQGQPLPWGDAASFQSIALSPVVPELDGLRVEAFAACGGTCGTGAVYVLVATSNGFKVTGIDYRYGVSVA